MAGLQHLDDMYETPDWIIRDITRITHLEFETDVCANDDNSKCMFYIDEEMDLLKHDFKYHHPDDAIFCNPPRSINGKCVNKLYNVWKEYNINIVMLLCWNDLGNKYGEKLLPHILKKEIMVRNLGKVKFCKDGIESEFPSRLTYMWAWFKKQ